jgi:uncharacterized protein YegP (UPF0339 family)
MKKATIEIFYDVIFQFRFRIKSANGEIICQGESYTTRRKCKQCIETLATILYNYSFEDGSVQLIDTTLKRKKAKK